MFGTVIVTSDSLTGNELFSTALLTLTRVCSITPSPKSIYFSTEVSTLTSLESFQDKFNITSLATSISSPSLST